MPVTGRRAVTVGGEVLDVDAVGHDGDPGSRHTAGDQFGQFGAAARQRPVGVQCDVALEGAGPVGAPSPGWTLCTTGIEAARAAVTAASPATCDRLCTTAGRVIRHCSASDLTASFPR
jgi:hypothetical protein